MKTRSTLFPPKELVSWTFLDPCFDSNLFFDSPVMNVFGWGGVGRHTRALSKGVPSDQQGSVRMVLSVS